MLRFRQPYIPRPPPLMGGETVAGKGREGIPGRPPIPLCIKPEMTKMLIEC